MSRLRILPVGIVPAIHYASHVLGHESLVAGGLKLCGGEGGTPKNEGLLVGIVIGAAPDLVGDDPSVDPVVALCEKDQVFRVEGVVTGFLRVSQGLGIRGMRPPFGVSRL
jgi:hypothetical protein